MTGLLAAVVLGAAQVTLRGAEAPPPGKVVAVDAAGVSIAEENAPGVVIGWDRVASVTGDFAGAAERFLPAAEKAWRARARLERGDAVAAEPLFEELFRADPAVGGPAGAVIAEGLLRCRLRRGAHVAAIEPWLALRGVPDKPATPWLHADWTAEAGLSPILDHRTRLIPGIPPIWVGPGAARVMTGLPLAAPIGPLYLAAAKFEAGEPVPVPEPSNADAGAALVAEIVRSRAGTPQDRAAAREALTARLPSPGGGDPIPAWMEAWCRAAIGRSMILEADPEVRRLGVVELLELPARFEQVHPYLAGLCLAQASVTLRELGDGSGADTLHAELIQKFPGHPVMDWAPILSRGAARPATPPSP